MRIVDFVKIMVTQLNEVLFCELRDTLADEYIPVSIMDSKDMTPSVFAEKICDYFEKCELKSGKSFEKIIERFESDLDSIVESEIAKEPKQKRKDTAVAQIPRARKYYDKADSLRKTNKQTKQELYDYSRLMMCLYVAIIKKRGTIEDFDFLISCLNINSIIDAMKNEKALLGRKLRFDIKEPYELDRCTFVITIIMYYAIKNGEVKGEY